MKIADDTYAIETGRTKHRHSDQWRQSYQVAGRAGKIQYMQVQVKVLV